MPATPTGVATAPGRLPLFGHMHRLLTKPRDFFESLRDRGGIVTIGLGPTVAYVINEPSWVHPILTRGVHKLDKGIGYEKSAPFLGNGLLNSTEPTHMAHRRLMQPAFHPAQIAGYADQMRESAEQRATAWRDGQVVEFGQEIHAFMVAVVCRALFSADLGNSVAVQVGGGPAGPAQGRDQARRLPDRLGGGTAAHIFSPVRRGQQKLYR